MASIFAVHLDTGLVYQADGTKTVVWQNTLGAPFQVIRVTMWGGISIGAIMDFAEALYITNVGNLIDVGVREVEWFPLSVRSMDRYGPSNGKPYMWDVDYPAPWPPIICQPGASLILQANCVQHNPGTNPVIGTPAASDNVQAQAYVYMKVI